MRKASREMSAEWAMEVLEHAPYITVSMCDENGMPYSVPLSLVHADNLTFYFHCATEGKKLDILSKNPNVCLSAVTKCKPTIGPKDGSFTLEFKSAIAFGKAEIVSEEKEKIEALHLICERFLPQHISAFNDAIGRSLSRTAIVRVTLTEPPIGKRKQYDANGDEMKYGRME